jgi:hypothetical protein
VTIIVDRGITMSARGSPGSHQLRYQEAAQMIRQPLVAIFGFGPTQLILVPGGTPIDTDRLDWYRLIDSDPAPPTDTRPLLHDIVSRALEQSARPVLVLSDQHLSIDDPRLIHIPAATSAKNVGIVSLSARRSPTAQLMLRVRNDSEFTSTMLKIDVDGNESLRRIELPLRGQEKTYFIDVPAIADRVVAELQVDDDIAIDNRATVIVKQSWPAIETSGALPDEVRRVIDAYSKLRPADASSPRMRVTTDTSSTAGPAVIVALGKEILGGAVLDVKEHPINESVDWKSAPADFTGTPAPDGEGWRPIVSAGSTPMVAVRDAPTRQVWIGGWSDTFARTSKFVIFWTNVLDWVGRGGESFQTQATAAVPIPEPFQSDWLAKTRGISPGLRKGMDLASGLLLAATALVLVALMLWGGPRSA